MSGTRLFSARSLAVCFAMVAPLLLLPGNAPAQDADAPVNASDHPLLRAFSWRSIGPYGQGGRVDDLAVNPDDPHTYYVGFATGGLWKTTNNGTTFESIFDSYGTHSIGAARGRALQPGRRLGRDRRGQQPAELLVRGRRLQVRGRRQDLHPRGAARDAIDRARDRPS